MRPKSLERRPGRRERAGVPLKKKKKKEKEKEDKEEDCLWAKVPKDLAVVVVVALLRSVPLLSLSR